MKPNLLRNFSYLGVFVCLERAVGHYRILITHGILESDHGLVSIECALKFFQFFYLLLIWTGKALSFGSNARQGVDSEFQVIFNIDISFFLGDISVEDENCLCAIFNPRYKVRGCYLFADVSMHLFLQLI